MMWAAMAVVALVILIAYVVKGISQFCSRLDTEMKQQVALVLEDPSCLRTLPCPSICSPASKSLSIVIPAYNEADRLGGLLEETISYLQHRRNRQGPLFTYEIIVVDDGSKDDTVKVAFGYVKQFGLDAVRVLRLPVNRGKGNAVRQGMLISRGEVCLFQDADGATRVSDLDKLEAELAKVQVTVPLNGAHAATAGAGGGPLGMAIGSRAHLKEDAIARRTWLRNLLMHGFHWLVTLVAGGAVRDTQCGFKLFTRGAAGLLFANQRLQRWCFDVELLYLARTLGVPVAEVMVNWTEMPGSKIRFSSIIHMAFELLTVAMAYQWLGIWRPASPVELLGKIKSS